MEDSMIDENANHYNKCLLEKVSTALKKNNYPDVRICDTSVQAKQEILGLIPENAKIGVGGSVTLRQLGITDEIKGRNVVKHEPSMGIKERKKVWREALFSDIYLASPQAITYKGELFFLDKYGNRVSAVIFGPSRIILVAGYNKIVPDFNSAIFRMRNTAAVKNTTRLKTNTPCVQKGECLDCASEERICNAGCFLLKKPSATDYSIILVNEELGY